MPIEVVEMNGDEVIYLHNGRVVRVPADLAAVVTDAERARCLRWCQAIRPSWHALGCGCSECVASQEIEDGIRSGNTPNAKGT